MNKKLFFLTSLLFVLLLSSCSKKNFVYLQDMKPGVSYPYDDRYEAVVHRDDRLGITVSGKNPELAIPFNIYSGSVSVSASGDVRTNNTTSSKENGYRVDVNGDIDFPILGKLHVIGMTVSQVRDLIKEKIEEGNYMKDPLVSVEFLNFKYTVLGAVSRNGTFSIEGDRITLLEAIANAGDLTSKARTDRVTVIREIDGKRQMYVHDLKSISVFDSPCFYLQQNDIVYVEPEYGRKSSEDRGWQVTTLVISLASLACSLVWALK